MAFKNEGASGKWFTFMVGFSNVCVRIEFFESIQLSKFVALRFLQQETIVEWVLKEFCKRTDLNLFCHSVSVLEVVNNIVRFTFWSNFG